jgi:glucosamine-6-phosphate deaminase
MADAVTMVTRIKPQIVWGLAHGRSPRSTYNALTRRVELGRLDFRRATGFALTEYVALPEGDRRIQRIRIRDGVTTPLGLHPSNVQIPDGTATDPHEAALRYDHQIRAAGGVDLQILGLRSDGAIGFNQPGSSATSATRVVDVEENATTLPSRIFARPSKVTHKAITQGIGTILQARSVAVVVVGESKARALATALEGTIGPHSPASFLRLHPNVTFYCDAAAAVGLRNTGNG